MSLDPLLPIAPARVRALLIPLGKLRAERFASFAGRLRLEHVVHLRDISADARPNRNMFSPLAYPDGTIMFDLITHLPPPSHLSLSPFDLHREPLAIIALADGKELQEVEFSKRHSGGRSCASTVEKNIRALSQELEDLRDSYPRALVHQVVIFDYLPPMETDIPMPEGIVAVPPLERCKRTTVKTVMCDISSRLLAEMTMLARSFEAMAVIDSPGQYSATGQLFDRGHGLGDGDINGSTKSSPYISPALLGLRSNSVTSADGQQTRMSIQHTTSLPLIKTVASSAITRSSTPATGGTPSSTPVNLDDGSTVAASPSPSPDERTSGLGQETAPSRESSHERVQVQGFGPGDARDRLRSRTKGRLQVILGSMYLQAGRWSDSLRELSEAATAARSLNDHIWHGKALELILLNLFLLSWAKLDFQIPPVCFPSNERSSSNPLSPKTETEATDSAQSESLRSLQALLPELLDRILALYSRISAENLPPLLLAETTIRFCKILSAMHLCDGKFDQHALEMVVCGKLPETCLTTSPRLSITPARQYILNLLFRIFPSSATEFLTTSDRASILSGIATVLGPLGYHRKKAMVIRELVSVLIGGLVEARTRGAAEAGVHPASGLIAPAPGLDRANGFVALDLGEGDVEHGIEAFLELLCKSYGIIGYEGRQQSQATATSQLPFIDSDEAVAARILRQSSARFFGFTSIKLNILRACINFSEALPDFNGVLKFSSDLMRTAGSGMAPGSRREEAAPVIHRDEQARLVTNIYRTAGLVRRLGLEQLASEYWDEFLVRGIALDPLPNTLAPISHSRSALPGATAAGQASQEVNPFIYNPFLKEADNVATQTLVTGEPASFKVTLQNTYDVEVEIESIRLCTEGASFEATPEESLTLGPYRTQLARVTGVPKEAGLVNITGAMVKVRGCRERRFPIFTKPWTPQRAEKIKEKGLVSPEDGDSLATKYGLTSPEGRTLKLNVIREQPLVVIKTTSLSQSSIMILEGERRAFSVTLQNTSPTPVDFMLFSLRDSTQAPLHEALGKRDASAVELYERELLLTRKQALRPLHRDDVRQVAAFGEATFEFEMLGKPGLTAATIQLDYAHLGVAPEQVEEPFYTRQVTLDLTVTVNASIELGRVDILPVLGQLAQPLWERMGRRGPAGGEEYCLLCMDLRNAWPSQMVVGVEAGDGLTVEEELLPGKTGRLVIAVHRVYLEDAYAPIPSLDPLRKRQFVVSSKTSPEAERASREAFWCRERLLDELKATWQTRTGTKRNGSIELRGMRLTPRMVEAIRVEEVGIDVRAESLDGALKADGMTKGSCLVDEFMQLRVRITNRTTWPLQPLVRLMPALCHRPTNLALDHTRKFAWNGTLQQILPELKGKSSADFVIGATALCRGEFEIAASVEEVQVTEDGWDRKEEEEEEEEEERGEGEEEGDGEGKGEKQKRRRKKKLKKKKETQGQTKRPRSESQVMMDAALGAMPRRIWHSRRPCLLTVRERRELGHD